MFDSNTDVYDWIRQVANELAASQPEWADRLKSTLYGSTSGEALGSILATVRELKGTDHLKSLGRDVEADELIPVLRRALHVD